MRSARRPRLPTYVDLHEFRWTIEVAVTPNTYGTFSLHERAIRINPEINTSVVDEMDTLTHELLHCIWRSASLPRKREEQCVTDLSRGLTQLMLRNPHLLDYYRKAAAHEASLRNGSDERTT